jgi:diguanylate cyclase (GGDEF)-like protein
MASPALNRNVRESRRLTFFVLTGFALLTLLLAASIGHAVWNISRIEQRMRNIVDQRNRKIQLATDLQEDSYNRFIALAYQAMTLDPFDRDDHFQDYLKWGFHVGKDRNELRQMDLDAFEQANLKRQDQLIVKIVELQDQISDLAAQGQLGKAQQTLTTGLRPLHEQFIDTVGKLRRYERDHMNADLTDTHAAAHRATYLNLALGGGVLFLTLGIAGLTHRQFRRYAGTIDEQLLQLQSAGRKLEHQATHDALTGLANRTLFYHRLAEDLARALEDGYGLMVVYVDLDEFKPVNDRYGHATGDEMLKVVGQRLKDMVRVNDTVARLGGDEFALILNGIGDMEMRDTMCRKLAKRVGQPLVVGELTLTPSCSVGQAIYPHDGTRMEELLNVADARMYRSKRAHKSGH